MTRAIPRHKLRYIQSKKETKQIKSILGLLMVTKTIEQIKMSREMKETGKQAFLAIEKH
jgi:hypothetical protein